MQVRTSYGTNLESLHIGSSIGLLIDDDSRLHLYINGQDQGVAASDLPSYVFAVLDIYGQCEQVSIINPIIGEATNTLPENNEILSNHVNNATALAMESLSLETEDAENSREKADLECHEKENGATVMVDEMVESSVEVTEKDEEREIEEAEETEEVLAISTNGSSERDNDLANRNSQSLNNG